MIKLSIAWVLVVGLALTGCNSTSKTSDTDILSANTLKLIDVSVDSRDFSTTEIDISSGCPKALVVGLNSCNTEVP